jgi:hypothetical protein
VRDTFENLNLIVAQQSKLADFTYAAAAGAIGLGSLWLLIRYRKTAKVIDQRLVIGFACMIFAIISPRFKPYTYILLLPPTLYLLQVAEWRRQIALAAVMIVGIVVFPQPLSLLPVRLAFQLFANYMTLFAAALVWGGYVCVLYRATQPAAVGDKALERGVMGAEPASQGAAEP